MWFVCQIKLCLRESIDEFVENDERNLSIKDSPTSKLVKKLHLYK